MSGEHKSTKTASVKIKAKGPAGMIEKIAKKAVKAVKKSKK